MFMLTEIVDLVRIFPHEFYKSSSEVVEDKVNEKFSDKIIPKIGLGLYMYDLLDASEGLIGHGDGLVNVNVRFRLLVFRPPRSTILTARISAHSPHGLWLDCDLYADIFVPAHLLFPNTRFEKDEQGVEGWVWHHEGEQLWMDVGEVVRARVEGEVWGVDDGSGDDKRSHDGGRSGGEAGAGAGGDVNGSSAKAANGDEGAKEEEEGWKIICSMNGEAMGPLTWW